LLVSAARDNFMRRRAAPHAPPRTRTNLTLLLLSPPVGVRRQLWRVLVTLAAVAAALWLTALVRPWIPHTQFVFFYVAVVVGAVLGGLRLAALALILSLAAVELFLYASPATFELTAAVVIRNLTLATMALAAAVLIDRLRRARDAAERTTLEAQALARQLEEQRSDLELQVVESESLAADLEEATQRMREQAAAALRAGDRSEKLQRLTSLLLEAVGENAVARVMTRDGRAAAGASAAVLAILRDQAGLQVVGVEGVTAELVLPRTGDGLLNAVLERDQGLWLEDVASAAETWQELAAVAGTHGAWCALPLWGERRQLGVLAFGFPAATTFEAEDRLFLPLLAQQCAQALERARLHETSLRARVRAEFAERRLELLAEATGRLAASLNYEATLSSLADLAVPDLADWCLVHLHDEHGPPRLVAVAHADPQRAAQRRQLEAARNGGTLGLLGFDDVVSEDAAHHIVHIGDDLLSTLAADAEQLAVLRSFGVHSQLTVPIRGEVRIWGALTFSAAESERAFSEADVRLAVELGRRAGQAVDNARLYEAAHFASEAKSNFLAVMSHELRTPLNAIIGYTDLLLLGVPTDIPERARRQIERVRSASNSLLQLVEEVLSFSRIEAGKEEIRISPVNLSVLLSDAVAMIEPMAAEKSLSVELRLPDAPLKVISDEGKIRQIVTNLLSNAVKFTETGRITVEAEADEHAMRISLHDTGIGIPEEHLERIFDPFWQVEQASTRRFGGTGLGLGVARKLAKLLEGRLDVASEEGKGSTFTLTLPRHTPGAVRPG
jgi:signal transduction histidine kinase